MNIFWFFLVLLILVYFYALIFYKNFKYKTFYKFQDSLNYKKNNTISLIAYLFLFLSVLTLALVVFFTDYKNIKHDKSSKTNIVFLLDVSKSMKAMDYNDSTKSISRLDTAKNFIKNFVESNSDFSYGLSVFAWETVWVAPIMDDLDMFLTFLSWVDENNVSKQWTDIYQAISWALNRFLVLENKNSKNILVLLSDWWDSPIWNNLSEIKAKMKENNIDFYVVWIWTAKWAYIPEKVDVSWEITYKMYNSKKVLVKLDENSLKDVATRLDWKYFSLKSYADNLDIISSKNSIINLNFTKNMYLIILSFIYFILYISLLYLPKILWRK